MTYAATAVMNFRKPTKKEMEDHYGSTHPGMGGQEIMRALDEQRIAPIILAISKGRGMTRGEIFFDYHYENYVFSERPHLSDAEVQRVRAERDEREGQRERQTVEGLVLDALRLASQAVEEGQEDAGLSRTELTNRIRAGLEEADIIRSYDLLPVLASLVSRHLILEFTGRNPNGTGASHSRWRLVHRAQ
jgi:hypothetical protein